MYLSLLKIIHAVASVKNSINLASQGNIEKSFYESKSAFESSGKFYLRAILSWDYVFVFSIQFSVFVVNFAKKFQKRIANHIKKDIENPK